MVRNSPTGETHRYTGNSISCANPNHRSLNASVLERLPQTGTGLVPDRAACGLLDLGAHRFRQINKATGNRLRKQLVDEETREPVGPEHKGRGYEVAKASAW